MKRAKRKKSKSTLIGTGLAIVLIGGIAANAVKYSLDEQAKKEYQALQKEVKKAEDKAYDTRKETDIKKAEKIIATLKKEDKELETGKIKALKIYLSMISVAQKNVDKVKANNTDDTILEAQKSIDLLIDAYVTKDKEKLQNLLDNAKAALAKKKAEAMEKANAEIEAKKYDGKKLIALTFDDGPNPMTTPTLLDILKKENVPVTFFALGQRAQEYPDIIKREAAEGHEVGSHTWDHQDLRTLSLEDQKQEIERANTLINSLTGKQVMLFRPPYGSYTQDTLNQTSLSAVNWSVDTSDWRYNSSALIAENALVSAHDGAIVLLHDIHSSSVGAVPKIISELKAQGYTFVTVSDLLNTRAGGAKAHQIYFGQ